MGPREQSIPAGTQTLSRGLRILRAVASGESSLSEVVSSTGIGRSTAHRMLQLLEQEGYIERRNRKYVLGPALIEFGFLALSQNPVPVVARPTLERLAATYMDTVHLGIIDDAQVLYLDKVSGSRGAVARSRIGYRMPLTRTGIGRALLLDSAHTWEELFRAENPDAQKSDRRIDEFLTKMTEYQKTGVTFDFEENERGVRCVGAPIRNGSGRIVASISISAASPYFPIKRMEALIPVMRDAVSHVSRKLGFTPKAIGK